MNPGGQDARAPGGGATAADPLADAGALARLVRQVVRQFSDLLACELRRAGISISVMLGLGLFLAALATGTWALLCAAAAVALVHAGLPLAAGLLLVALLNAAAAVVVMLAIRASSHGLTFPATRRSLGGGNRRADDSPVQEDDHARTLASA